MSKVYSVHSCDTNVNIDFSAGDNEIAAGNPAEVSTESAVNVKRKGLR
jgi:hypothetical protein